MPKKRCPNCRSINTQRYGSYRTKSLRASGKRQRRIQRYYCLDCHTSFSERAEAKSTKRYEPSLILKIADLYFNAEASYRAVGRRLHIRPYQLFLWINELGKSCKSFEELVLPLLRRDVPSQRNLPLVSASLLLFKSLILYRVFFLHTN